MAGMEKGTVRAYFDDGTPLGSAVNPECKMIRSLKAGLAFGCRSQRTLPVGYGLFG